MDYSSGYGQNEERVSHVLSPETIRAAVENAARNSATPGQQSLSAQHSHSSYEPDRPGIARRDTASRRDPLTGDLIEEYSGQDPSGPGIRAHYNWDEPGKAPTNIQPHSSGASGASSRSSGPPRTNTTVSYDSRGNRIEEYNGDESLRVRALYNDDENPGTVYRPPHQSADNSRRY